MVSSGHFLHFLVNFKDWRWNVTLSLSLKIFLSGSYTQNKTPSVKIWCFYFPNKFQDPMKIVKNYILKLCHVDIFCIFYYLFRNEDKILLHELFFVENIHRIEQLLKIWQLFHNVQTSFQGPKIEKNDSKLSPSVIFCIF